MKAEFINGFRRHAKSSEVFVAHCHVLATVGSVAALVGRGWGVLGISLWFGVTCQLD